MGDTEGVGEAVMGGVTAAAVEPDTGAVAGAGHANEAPCLNCGANLIGDYCHTCGQRCHVHRTLRAFFHDLLHGVFHFEGKIWRTLPLLAWRPGELTRRYIDGERARFVSPIALFLFSVFLMFAVFSAVGEIAYDDRTGRERAAESAEVEQGAAEVEATKEDLVVLAGADTINRWANDSFRRAKENPSLLIYKLQSNAYKFSWALIPISVPLVWLLFLHRRRYRRFKLYDHTVFATYSIAFMTVFMIAYTLLKLAGLIGTVALLPFAIIPIHMYRQLRGAYSLNRPSALWRTACLIVFANAALAVFLTALLLLGLLG
ncbi:MAG: DUF3667 domain-containing protein [Pseudomonadota bacterium]|nr:DUF3667 domain-containing protein [Pseudomonadota bacterium]